MNAGLFCGSGGALVSKLDYQISISPHLLYVIDGLLLRGVCKQHAAHLKCQLFTYTPSPEQN